jgi:hypothetical protein
VYVMFHTTLIHSPGTLGRTPDPWSYFPSESGGFQKYYTFT